MSININLLTEVCEAAGAPAVSHISASNLMFIDILKVFYLR